MSAGACVTHSKSCLSDPLGYADMPPVLKLSTDGVLLSRENQGLADLQIFTLLGNGYVSIAPVAYQKCLVSRAFLGKGYVSIAPCRLSKVPCITSLCVLCWTLLAVLVIEQGFLPLLTRLTMLYCTTTGQIFCQIGLR